MNADRTSPSVPEKYLALFSRVCAVTKRLEKEGFLITAYPTDAIKEGVFHGLSSDP